MIAVCRHCGIKKANRPRGLCWRCYHAPGVRRKYPSGAKNAGKTSGWESRRHAHAKQSTVARPGTEEKILILQARATRGEYLFHPDDVTVFSHDDRLMAD